MSNTYIQFSATVEVSEEVWERIQPAILATHKVLENELEGLEDPTHEEKELLEDAAPLLRYINQLNADDCAESLGAEFNYEDGILYVCGDEGAGTDVDHAIAVLLLLADQPEMAGKTFPLNWVCYSDRTHRGQNGIGFLVTRKRYAAIDSYVEPTETIDSLTSHIRIYEVE